MDERREAKRDGADLAASLVVKQHPGGKVLMQAAQGLLVNRSRSGACVSLSSVSDDGFHLLRCLEDPELFEVTLHVAGPTEKTPKREVRVVWLNRVYEEGAVRPFRLGLQFDPWKKEGRPKAIRDPTSDRLGIA